MGLIEGFSRTGFLFTLKSGTGKILMAKKEPTAPKTPAKETPAKAAAATGAATAPVKSAAVQKNAQAEATTQATVPQAVAPKRAAIKPAVPKATPESVIASQPVVAAEPTRAEIAELAYLYWEARGFHGGSEREDWLRAEAELKRRAVVKTASAGA
jgi:hypothetical protein